VKKTRESRNRKTRGNRWNRCWIKKKNANRGDGGESGPELKPPSIREKKPKETDIHNGQELVCLRVEKKKAIKLTERARIKAGGPKGERGWAKKTGGF